MQQSIEQAVQALHKGGIIAYPTEAVYGLGCDPTMPAAIQKLLDLKQRTASKGLILISASFDQLKPYIEDVDLGIAVHAQQTWPGPFTWVWPARPSVSSLLTGNATSLAVRVSDHPIVKQLCDRFGGAIVSSSANIQQQAPARTAKQVEQYFANNIDAIIDAPVGSMDKPTPIYDLLTRQVIRS